MKVILLQDVRHLGKKNDITDVSEGYARNFLLPKHLVAPATTAVLQDVAQKKAHKEKTVAIERQHFASAATKMGGMALSFKMKMGEKGKTFGSVSTTKIAEALRKAGITADKEWIVLEDPIKTMGEHTIAVRFPHDITGKIKIIVEPE
ncbi:MAG: 50S ribosomal protein L9 [Patescibacteria group bacterium]